MSLYSQIFNNKARSFFILAIFVTVFVGFFYMVGLYVGSPSTYLIIGFLFSATTGFASYYWSDKIVLMTSKAKLADRRKYFDFYTSVENLSLASGIAMPKVYVIDDPSPNAFATGRNPKNAVICATTGLLNLLDRSDIEGVVAHELSHIKNYDILLSSIVAVLVGTIALAADSIMRSMWWGSRDRNNNRSQLFYVFFILALIITPVAATLIQLSISRKREFLADAGGVLITRNSKGLISALKKIAAYPHPLRNTSPSISHLFISDPLKKRPISWFNNLFSTHPPVEERIKILESL